MVSELKLTLPERHLIVKEYLQSNEFKVLQYEENENSTSSFSIKIGVSFNNSEREVRFLAKSIDSNQEVFSYKFLDNFKNSDFASKYYFTKNYIINPLDEGLVSTKTLDIEHIKLVLKTLAAYHAQSVVLEETKSDKLEEKYKVVDEYANFQDAVKIDLKNLNLPNDTIQNSELTNDEFKKRLLNIVENFKCKRKLFRSVLCHGNLWNDGLLFKYKDGKPCECKLTNFQLQKYNPPALDVLELIYTSTTQNFRQHHLHELLNFYYDSLKQELTTENLQAMLFSIEDFEVSVHHCLPITKLQLYSRLTANKSESFQPKDKVTESLLELRDVVIQSRLTIEDCFKIIKNKTGTTNYELLNYKLSPLGIVAGFLGDHNRLKIDVCIENKNMTLNLFAKFMATNSTSIEVITGICAFYKEIFFYDQFISMIKSFGLHTITDCVVPYYFSRQDEVLIFEDLGQDNFRTLEPRLPFSVDIVRIVVKKIAKFHSCGIILEEKLGESVKTKYCLNKQFPKELQESVFTLQPNHRGGDCVKSAINAIDTELELFPDPNYGIPDEELKIKIDKAFKAMYESVNPSDQFRNVLCHGDLWINNVLVQYQDEKPTDCRFIDFQVSRYCPPAQDLLSFLYLTTSRSVRKHHLNELIDLYYNELSENLKYYGYDIDKLLPRDSFMTSIDYMTPQAVCQTVLYFQTALANSEILNQFGIENILIGDRTNYLREMAKRDPLFTKRATESVQDLRELCTKYF